MQHIENGVCAPLGFKAHGMHAGIRKNKNKKDLALIVSEVPASAGAIYTQNKVKGAPIQVTKEHLMDGHAQAMLCNSANANTCNENGEEIAKQMCVLCADALGIKPQDIIVASTGVIGMKLPIEPFVEHMDELVAGLNDHGSLDAVNGIMTTDTFPKETAVEFTLNGKICHIGGIAKGSGMIHPNMATMLCFLTSDVAIAPSLLQEVLKEVGDDTFNMISVDGDTSTNDMMAMMANGLAGNEEITKKNEDYLRFKEALFEVSKTLSRMLASDGEGATKLLTCEVYHAATIQDAKTVAKSVITSSLFKAAMFGCDANWGRILCAIGYADANYDVDKIDVWLKSEHGSLQVCKEGKGANQLSETGIDEEKALAILQTKEVVVRIDLHDGIHYACAWGCDLTYDYVKINGDYRT